MLRIGLAGLGYWGSKHARVLSSLENTEILGIDSREHARRLVSEAVPQMKTIADFDDALDRVDAVVIATPPETHHPLASRAIAAGKHVLVEKPLALSSWEAEDLLLSARSAGVVLMVGHTFQYNRAVGMLRELVQSGDLGEILYIDTTRVNLGLYQRRCSVLWDLAPHDVSILAHVIGLPVREVRAWGEDHAGVGVADNAYIRIDYGPDLPKATTHVSWLSPKKIRDVVIVGSSKMAVYDDLADEHRLRIYDKGISATEPEVATTTAPMSYRYGNIVSPYVEFTEPLLVEDRHFVECITTGTNPISDAAVGLEVVRVLEAAEMSIQDGGMAVPLQPSELVLPDRGIEVG